MGRPGNATIANNKTSPRATSRAARRRAKGMSARTKLSPSAKDSDLIALHFAGDDHALEILLDRYEEVLFHFLVGVLKNHHQAEDALQETWCQALQNLDNVNGDTLRGWLFTVAFHQAMLYKRRQKGQSPSTLASSQLVDPGPCPRAQAQTEEELVRVQRLLERLPAAQRDVICQRIYEGKRFRDIADAMDCPINTALARMHDGLKKLRRLWGPDYV